MGTATIDAPAAPDFYQTVLGDDGRPYLALNFHPGQERAWVSDRRFVTVLAGTQSGKTQFGPCWLHREIYGDPARPGRGPGDYLAVTASYDLFKLKMLPALREYFEHLTRSARFWSGDRILELKDPQSGKFWARRADDPMWGRIILRSAESGGGLESTTALGGWLDEAGQGSFGIDSWEAVLRRVSLSLGRLLLTTTLYNFGWLKAEVYDRWAAGSPDIEVIQFDSTENPHFPAEEFERARATMPRWRFDMAYRGAYSRPAGLIYDAFDEAKHVCPAFPIPDAWPRALGLDFGGQNTAGVFVANEPGTRRWYLYRDYHAGGLTARQHAERLLAGESKRPWPVCGGSKSEGQWRGEFAAAGLPVQEPPISDVELGILRCYGWLAADELIVFNTATGFLDEIRSYSRKLDRAGQPTDAIEAKETYHRLDAFRYIGAKLRDGRQSRPASSGTWAAEPNLSPTPAAPIGRPQPATTPGATQPRPTPAGRRVIRRGGNGGSLNGPGFTGPGGLGRS